MENSVRLVQTKDDKVDILVIEAGTIEGVNIPCVLAIPKKLQGKNQITLAFNNENGTTLNQSCSNIQSDMPQIIDMLQIEGPILVPILPSTKEFNQTLQNEGINFNVGEPKQFAKECFDSTIPPSSTFYRIDEQVTRLIESIMTNPELKASIQAQRTSNDNLEFDEKLVGFGHSGGGAAMLRFALIRPELFDTLIIGGNGDIIPTPFGENGRALEYPFGIKDYSETFGREFSEEDYKSVNFQFYIGDREDTKPVYDTIRDSNYQEGKSGPLFAPEKLAVLYKNMYGTPFFERFKNALHQYEIAGANIGLKIYENDCHSMITTEDFHNILDENKFFGPNCSEQLQALLDRRKAISTQELGKQTLTEQKDVALLDNIELTENRQSERAISDKESSTKE